MPSDSDSMNPAAGPEPRYPRTLIAAGLLWVVWGVVFPLIPLASSVGGFVTRRPLTGISIPILGVCLFGAALGFCFVAVGLACLRRTATASGILWAGIASIYFGATMAWFACMGMFRSPGVLDVLGLLWACSLPAAGVLVLTARTDYLGWQEARKHKHPPGWSGDGQGDAPALCDGSRLKPVGSSGPLYPRTVRIAGALWGVFGVVCALRPVCVPLVGLWTGHQDAFYLVGLLAGSVPIMLLGLLCARTGLKYLWRTATARSTLVPGVVSVLLGASFLCTGWLPGPFAPIWLATLVFAGVFALIGRKGYGAWREAQKLDCQRGHPLVRKEGVAPVALARSILD